MRTGGRNIAVIAALLLSLVPCLSFAAAGADGPFSAADLRVMCTSKSDVDYGYCAGYISAVSHALLKQNVDGYRACNQANVRSQQLVDTFNTWAELFPDKMGTDAEGAVAASLARAFPCGN